MLILIKLRKPMPPFTCFSCQPPYEKIVNLRGTQRVFVAVANQRSGLVPKKPTKLVDYVEY